MRDGYTEDWSRLLERQRELEDAGTAAGAARFLKRLDQAVEHGAASTVGAARNLLRDGLRRVEAAIQRQIDEPQLKCASNVKRKGTRATNKGHLCSRDWTQMVGPSVTAFLALKVTLDASASGQATPIIDVATQIADLMMDELRYRRFKSLAPRLFEYKVRTLRRSHSRNRKHQRNTMKASMRVADIDCADLDLSSTERMRLGLQVLDMLCESLGWWNLVRPQEHRGKKAPTIKLVLRDEIRRGIASSNELLALTRPVLGPMVVPPLAWAHGERGGYYFALAHKFPLVTKSSRGHEQFVASATMPKVYAALNAIQETPWRINQQVLDIVQEVRELGGGFAGIPCSSDKALPAKPLDIATNLEAKRAWKTEAHAVHRENLQRRIDDAKVGRVLTVAEEVQGETAIYFPHHLDFRGRVYPIASYLTPQGDDLSRSLLQFADQKPIDSRGRRWLAIHGANLLGMLPDGRKASQLSLDQRIEAIEGMTVQLVDTATDPIGKPGLWMQADKPLQFLAFLLEWSELVAAESRGEVYSSALACGMDGTCNGLQHLSALFLDEQGGAAVNLTPTESPRDIYGAVAETCRLLLAEKARLGDTVASRWLSLHQTSAIVDRKLAKRPTMTFGYGSKRFGFRSQLLAMLEAMPEASTIAQHFAEADEPEWRARFRACTTMAQTIWEALQLTAVSASAAMQWMTTVAKGIAAQNAPVEWVTPTGFPVRQPYRNRKQIQTQVVLSGQIVAPVTYTDAPTVNRKKQAAGLAPNLTHSLDASHLVSVVDAAAGQGVSHFHVIHDSFGTHAADCGKVSQAIREQFVAMYSQDVIGDLYRQFQTQCKDPRKLPAAPGKGSLDLSGVLTSDYFFA